MLAFPMPLVPYLPTCNCNRILTGRVQVGFCACGNCYCEICLSSWSSTSVCQTCQQAKPAPSEVLRERVAYIMKECTEISREAGGDLEAAKKRMMEIKDKFLEDVKSRDDMRIHVPLPPSQQPPLIPMNSSHQYEHFVPESGEPMVVVASVEEVKQDQAPPESCETMQCQEQMQFIPFALVEEKPYQSICQFCNSPLPSHSKGRCRCNKVNYFGVGFNKEEFLGAKWECPNLSCRFRNVHSNQKCIECGANKMKGHR